jgi:sulfatase modifying factor 1
MKLTLRPRQLFAGGNAFVILLRRALSTQQAQRNEVIELRNFLVEHFSREELEVFCADYFRDVYLDYEGSSLSKSQWAHKLVEYCVRRHKLANLRAALQKERAEPYTRRFPLTPVTDQVKRSRDPRQIFISYAHEDAHIARRLAADLRRHEYPVWIAPESIQPGESWVSAIDRGLHESGVFLALLSPAAVKSQWMKSETRLAIQLEHQGKLRLVPMMLKPCDPSLLSSFLTSYQIIPAVGRYEQALAELLVELGLSPARVAADSVMRWLRSPTGKRRWPHRLVVEAPIKLELLRIPRGSFWMGSHIKRDRAAQTNELPRHRVRLSDYYIARYPVTNQQYAFFAQATQRNFKLPAGKEDHPVANVSWNDAVAFCDWLSQTTGLDFGLPTEAEWEKAARGTDGRIYPWGDEFDARRLNSREGNVQDTTPVGWYSPGGDSPYGVADMCGNTWEWCADWYDDEEYPRRAGTHVSDPRGPAQGVMRVLRGGAFDFNKDGVRCGYRAANFPHERSYDYGFRLVLRP